MVVVWREEVMRAMAGVEGGGDEEARVEGHNSQAI